MATAVKPGLLASERKANFMFWSRASIGITPYPSFESLDSENLKMAAWATLFLCLGWLGLEAVESSV
jgi:hypothetical protein